MSFHQIIPSFVIVLFASTSMKNKSCVHFTSCWVHSPFLMGSMLFIFLFFCFLLLRSVFVSKVASVSGLSILDCHLVFSNV